MQININGGGLKEEVNEVCECLVVIPFANGERSLRFKAFGNHVMSPTLIGTFFNVYLLFTGDLCPAVE